MNVLHELSCRLAVFRGYISRIPYNSRTSHSRMPPCLIVLEKLSKRLEVDRLRHEMINP